MALFPLPLSPPRERAPSIPAATEGGGHVARPTPPRCKRCAPARDRYRNVTAKGTHAASATSYALRRGIIVVAVRGVLIVVDQKSRYSLFEKLADKKASTVAEAMIRRLRGFKTRSLTYDNGLEFAKHLEVGRELGAKSYFCAPYHAWEKGLVENHNGLLRQYYPKGESFDGLNEDSLRWVEEDINERPRKLLEYACPMLYLNRLTAA